MEFIVNLKRICFSTKNKTDDTPLGLLRLILFSPVKKVSYKIDSTRAGDALDYDKLTMQVETNEPY